MVKVVGGTSASAPVMAAITALLVQKIGEPQGNINPRLYAIAATSPGAFHDVTQGSIMLGCNLQLVECPFGQFGFQAGPGYDQATGLGSVDATNLINAWPDFGLSSNPAVLTVARGNVGTATISVSSVNGFNDAVTLSCTVSNSLTNTTCSIPSAPSPGGMASLTITAGATASLSFWELPPSGRDSSTGIALLLLTTSALLLWQRRRRTTLGAYACVLLAVATFDGTSCGNGSASGASITPAARPVSQTGTVTITASAHTSSKSLTLPVTVQ
jgi:pseudomonalisin